MTLTRLHNENILIVNRIYYYSLLSVILFFSYLLHPPQASSNLIKSPQILSLSGNNIESKYYALPAVVYFKLRN